MPNEFKVKNGLIVDQGGATITGSIIATSGFTGSLFGTASLATTASFALAVDGGGGGAAFPFTGSALITGSLVVTGSTTLRNGQTTIQGAGATSATTAFLVRNNTPTTLFQIQDHGSSSFNGNLTITGSLNQASASLASGLFSHVQGFANTASGIYSHAEGQSTKATGSYSHAEGLLTTARGSNSHAEGQYSVANGDFSHAEGAFSATTGQNAHAEGFSTTAQGLNSHAEGQQTTTTGQSSHAEGLFTSTIADMSHAEGVQTVAQGVGSHAEGGWYYYDDGDFIFPGGIAAGNASHAEGLSTLASGEGAHAEGYYTTASGNSSHAEGYYTIANGVYQHVQGQFNQSSSAQSAFIIGNGTSTSARSNLVFASGSQFQITGSLSVTGSVISNTDGLNRLARYGTAISGSTIGTGVTAQTIVFSQLIPANTFVAGDIFRTYYRFRKLATNGNATHNILVNTSNAVAGATTLALFTTNTVHTQIKRDFYIAQGNATTSISSGISTATDDANNTQGLTVINWAVDQYIIYTVTLNTADSGYGLGYTIEQVL
jgi:trimeric autotransporter adhesin